MEFQSKKKRIYTFGSETGNPEPSNKQILEPFSCSTSYILIWLRDRKFTAKKLQISEPNGSNHIYLSSDLAQRPEFQSQLALTKHEIYLYLIHFSAVGASVEIGDDLGGRDALGLGLLLILIRFHQRVFRILFHFLVRFAEGGTITEIQDTFGRVGKKQKFTFGDFFPPKKSTIQSPSAYKVAGSPFKRSQLTILSLNIQLFCSPDIRPLRL